MMESQSVATNYNKTGYEAFCPTIFPPQLYLNEKVIITRKYNRSSSPSSSSPNYRYQKFSSIRTEEHNYDINNVTLAEHPSDCRNFTLQLSSTYNQHEHGSVVDDSRSLKWTWNDIDGVCSGTWNTIDSDGPHSGDSCSTNVPWYDAVQSADSDLWEQVLDKCEETLNEQKSLYVDSGSNYDYDEEEHSVSIRSNPFTDVMLKKEIVDRMPGWPTKWTDGSGLAFYEFENDRHWCAGAGKMQYRVKVPDSKKLTTYFIEWYEVTQDLVTTNRTSDKRTAQVIGTGDPVNPAVGKEIFTVDIPEKPSKIWATAPVVVRTAGGDGSGPSGHAAPGDGKP